MYHYRDDDEAACLVLSVSEHGARLRRWHPPDMATARRLMLENHRDGLTWWLQDLTGSINEIHPPPCLAERN